MQEIAKEDIAKEMIVRADVIDHLLNWSLGIYSDQHLLDLLKAEKLLIINRKVREYESMQSVLT